MACLYIAYGFAANFVQVRLRRESARASCGLRRIVGEVEEVLVGHIATGPVHARFHIFQQPRVPRIQLAEKLC